ncbi:hypothetical protein GmHk_02G004622 [Glycine max]|nr:hypothetical protein GmHk_02G004622 [Glycine max]
MDEDQWMYNSIMSEEADMDDEKEQECGVNEQHVDCSDAFNTSQVFATRDDVLQCARLVAHENGFVTMIIRSRKKDFVRRDTRSRKCGCPFKLCGKPMVRRQGWMVKLMCGSHNHELAKSLVGHPYVRRLTKNEKTIISDMTKSMVKPRNIMLTLKEHNGNNCTTIKQIYNARSAYRSSIRGSDTEMQHLMKLLERDQYIHWHRLKDEDVFDDCLKKFEITCSPWPMVEYAHWALKRVLQNNLGDLCSVWDAMNNMITLQHTEIKASFEISIHVVGHVFKVTLYKRLLGMVSRYALNQIIVEFERVHYASKNPSYCGCVMRTTHSLPCACELSKYVLGSVPLDSIHMFWRRLSFSDQGLSMEEWSEHIQIVTPPSMVGV